MWLRTIAENQLHVKELLWGNGYSTWPAQVPSGAMKGSSIHVAGWGTLGAWTWETVLKWDPQDKQVGLQLGYITFAIVFVNMFPFISIYAWCICVYIYIPIYVLLD
jgi:hypothetical protein